MFDDDDDLPEFEVRRKRIHARVQAKSSARRVHRNAPRRDDLARAAYYVLLLTICEARKAGSSRSPLRPLLNLIEDAGIDREISAGIIEGHLKRVTPDIKAWVARRRFDRERAAERAKKSAADKK